MLLLLFFGRLLRLFSCGLLPLVAPSWRLVVFGPFALSLLPHGDLLPSGCRSYYMDLLLRMSILKTWYRSILRLLRIPLSSARSVETLVELLRATRLTRTRTRTLSKHARGANAPLSNSDNGASSTIVEVEPFDLLPGTSTLELSTVGHVAG